MNALGSYHLSVTFSVTIQVSEKVTSFKTTLQHNDPKKLTNRTRHRRRDLLRHTNYQRLQRQIGPITTTPQQRQTDHPSHRRASKHQKQGTTLTAEKLPQT